MRKGEWIPKEEANPRGIEMTDEFVPSGGISHRLYRDRNGQDYVREEGGYREVIFGEGEITIADMEWYEEKKKMAAKAAKERKIERKEKVDMPPANTDLERADLVEAQDIANNSDLVLQYEAPFLNRRTGKSEMRRWLGTNAWKLGLIEGYVKQGYSLSIKYRDTEELRICEIDLKKGEQVIHAEGSYTKSRLKNFLNPAQDECFDTFAFRNAIKRIVSLRDVVIATKKTQEELMSIDVMPTKAITDEVKK